MLLLFLITQGCGSSGSVVQHIEDLQGTAWKLLEVKTASGKHSSFSRQKLEAEGLGDFYTLRFEPEGISGKAAPNRYRAPYTRRTDREIAFNAIAGTLMASFKESEYLKEQEYYDYLRQVNRWHLTTGILMLYTRDRDGQEGTLIFGRDL